MNHACFITCFVFFPKKKSLSGGKPLNPHLRKYQWLAFSEASANKTPKIEQCCIFYFGCIWMRLFQLNHDLKSWNPAGRSDSCRHLAVRWMTDLGDITFTQFVTSESKFAFDVFSYADFSTENAKYLFQKYPFSRSFVFQINRTLF